MHQGQIVLLDTNILIETFRARCFKAFAVYYRLETVEKCYEEALTGDRLRSGYVEVDPAMLKEKIIVNRVASMELAALALTCPAADALDAGERHLFAHAHSRAVSWVVACADRAAMRVALKLGWEGCCRSLEVLLGPTGAKPELRRHFTERWLSQVRTEYILGGLS